MFFPSGGYSELQAKVENGQIEELIQNALKKFAGPRGHPYEYDLVVIGGGSGGLACSKEAASLGAKVALFDFIKPTPIGTTWGLGGTCVNVGCVPKKLMHNSAILGESINDSKSYGWKVDAKEKYGHDWETMRNAIQDHIGSLNFGYRVALRDNRVDYLNAYAKFIDPHRLEGTDKRGKKREITSDKVLIATGLRPKYPGIPGDREYGISSDDLFSLDYNPGKTLVVGASYVALECGGFLHGLGNDVTIMVRSILLRGFDQDMAERIGKDMANRGVKMVRPAVPLKVEQIEAGKPGRLRVTAHWVDGENKGKEFSEEYNTVIFAIGREPIYQDCNFQAAGVTLNPKNMKIPHNDSEQTNVPHIYAIGDVLDGKPELTPVAIQAGVLLARRLFGNSAKKMDYDNVPTTVFTPMEYGACGLSEETAISRYGDKNIEVYHTLFTPLEWTVSHNEGECYLKVICLKTENEKIIGMHYLGPNAGEVIQGK